MTKTLPEVCGTCRFWITDQNKTFKDKLKKRYQTVDPHCKHDGKDRSENDGAGCWWGWKEASPEELEKRGLMEV